MCLNKKTQVNVSGNYKLTVYTPLICMRNLKDILLARKIIFLLFFDKKQPNYIVA